MMACRVVCPGNWITLSSNWIEDAPIDILIVVNSMEKGGRTKRVAEECAGLRKRGHDVGLIAFSKPPDWVMRRYPDSSEWTIFEKLHRRFDFILFLRLLRHVSRRRPDIMLAHCESSALYMGLVGKLLRVPTVGTVHRSKLHFYNSSWKSRMYYRFLDSYIAVSHERKGRMHEQMQLPLEKIEVVHWGIDSQHLKSEVDRDSIRRTLGLDNRPIILSLGHLGTIKGHDDSIRALARVREAIPDVRLYIGGDGEVSDYERLHTLIEDLNLQESAILLGQVTNALEWMRGCDVFLQPSIEEAFGLVFIEAGLCRKPCVATDVGGIPEIISNGKSGFLVRPHDYELMSERIIELLRSKELRVNMGEAAFDFVSKNFDLETQVLKLEKHLSSVIESN